MKDQTKISKLKAALLRGEKLSPLTAWNRWKMAHNTFNRQLWELKRRGMVIDGIKVGGYKVHWLAGEKNETATPYT